MILNAIRFFLLPSNSTIMLSFLFPSKRVKNEIKAKEILVQFRRSKKRRAFFLEGGLVGVGGCGGNPQLFISLKMPPPLPTSPLITPID